MQLVTENAARRPGRIPDALPDPMLDVKGVAERMNVSLPTVWRGVADGRLPQPVYVAPRAPRWRWSEIEAALNATRAMPREQMERRRRAKLARIVNPT